jgi:uncharacterized membrane protein YeiB
MTGAATSAETPVLGGPATHPARTPRERLLGVDVARSVALLGMFVAHYAYQDGTGGVFQRATHVVDGKAMPLFLLLGGVGFTLLTRAARHPVRSVVARAAVLLALGIVLTEHVPLVAIILHFYAAYFVVGLLVRRLPDAGLLALAAAVTLAGGFSVLYLAPHLPAYDGWEGWATVRNPLPLLSSLFFTGMYPVLPSFAFFVVGMWAGRQRLGDPAVQVRLLAAGALLAIFGYGLGNLAEQAVADCAVMSRVDGRYELTGDARDDLVTRFGGAEALERHIEERMERTGLTRREVVAQLGRSHEQANEIRRPARLLGTAGHGNMPPWVIGATGTSLAVLGLSLLAAARFPRATWPLAMAGQLALTFYVAHTLALRWWWYDDLANDLTYAQHLLVIAGAFAVFVVAAAAWRRFLRYGPLEYVLRLAGSTR